MRTSYKRPDTPDPDPELYVKHLRTKTEYMEREHFPKDFAVEPPKGKIYDKKPFKITLEAGKLYAWCTCGHSKSQVRIHCMKLRRDLGSYNLSWIPGKLWNQGACWPLAALPLVTGTIWWGIEFLLAKLATVFWGFFC